MSNWCLSSKGLSAATARTPPGAKELRKGDQQVDDEDADVSHRANRTMAAGTCKTARCVRTASHCEFATRRKFSASCP